MKYVQEPGDYGIPTVELTRRNLLALLAKLDDSGSLRTIIDSKHTIAVKAVEDEEHYSDRPPGEMYIPSLGLTF